MEKKLFKSYSTPETLAVDVKMQTTLLQASVTVIKGDYGPWITNPTEGWE